MPLVIVTGYPKSGKTQFCNQLVDVLQNKFNKDEKLTSNKVVLINDESLRVDKSRQFMNSVEERKVRSHLMSAVDRNLSQDCLVIADAMNYIKGYRYQLFCFAKGVGTAHCTLYRAIPTELAVLWNNNSAEKYSDELMADLISRFEEPVGSNRWDSPLFLALQDSAVEDVGNQIFESFYGKNGSKTVRQNLSTVTRPVAHTDYMSLLQSTTSNIISAILRSYQEIGNISGSGISVPKTQRKVSIDLSTPPTLAQLKRLARAFINLNQRHTMSGAETIADSFVDYLNSISLHNDFLPISNRRQI